MKKLLVLILLSVSYAGATQTVSAQNSLKRDIENFEDTRQHCITLWDLYIGRHGHQISSRSRAMWQEEVDVCARVFLLARKKLKRLLR